MDLVINENRKISEIQAEFTAQYPFLKMEFFSRPHKPGDGTGKKWMKGDSLTLGECRRGQFNGMVHLNPKMSVSDLEQTFQSKFGLFMQVFRKSGKLWLETTVTDGWSLEEQNKQGRELSNAYEE